MVNYSSDQLRAPASYKHYKGTQYLVLGCSTHTETGEKLVVYRTEDPTPVYWTRPLAMFLEEVTLEDGSKTPRFTFVKWGSRFEA